MSPFLTQTYRRVFDEPPVAPPTGSAPTIVVDPADSSVLSGQAATLSVTATGAAPLTYQWYAGVSPSIASPIFGATSSSYTTGALTVDAQYWVRVSNAHGHDDSDTADVTIYDLPTGVLGPPEYLGAFRLSDNGYANTVGAYGGMAGRNDGGTIKLYTTSTQIPIDSGGTGPYQGAIIEVIDPGTYSTSYATSPIATTNFYTNEYTEKQFTWTPLSDDPSFMTTSLVVAAGLYWHEGNQRLYKAYVDTYDVTGAQLHSLLSIELVPETPSADTIGSTIGHGPWSITITDGDGQTRRGPRACTYMQRHPLTGDMMVGSTLTSGSASCPWGPSLFTGVPFPDDDTPVGKNELYTVPDMGLFYYFMGFSNYMQGGGFQLTSAGALQPGKSLRSFRRRLSPGPYEDFTAPDACNPGGNEAINVDPATYVDAIGPTGSWRDQEFVSGGTYIQIGTKAVYLYLCNQIDGHTWYQNECKPLCTHGLAPAASATGGVFTSAYPAMIGFDPADIDAVLNGDIEEWEVEASYEINMETQYPGFRTAPIGVHGGQKTVHPGYFDQTTRTWYIAATKADDTRGHLGGTTGTLFHAFRWPEEP